MTNNNITNNNINPNITQQQQQQQQTKTSYPCIYKKERGMLIL